MSRSRFLLVVLPALVGLLLIVGAYEIGRHMRQLSHDDGGVHYVKAMLAFAHYKSYGDIADYLEKKCYGAALSVAKEMRDGQAVLLADNLRGTGNDPSLLEYIKVRDPELLKSVLAGNLPELPTPAKPLTVTCP